MNTTQDDHYAIAQETASVIRPITADEAWLHAQLDRLDPHRLEAGGAGDTPALIKLVFELRAELAQRGGPIAWMFPDDLERFESSETFAQAYSVKCGSPTQGTTLPLYTAPQPERKPMDKEHRKAIIEAAINAHDDDGLLPDMERLSWVIDATEHHHGIKP